MQSSGTFSSMFKLFKLTGSEKNAERARPAAPRPGNAPQKGKSPASAAPGRFTLEGEVRAGREGMFSINNVEFKIDSNTWIIGIMEAGAMARVNGLFKQDGKLATKVLITAPAAR